MKKARGPLHYLWIKTTFPTILVKKIGHFEKDFFNTFPIPRSVQLDASHDALIVKIRGGSRCRFETFFIYSLSELTYIQRRRKFLTCYHLQDIDFSSKHKNTFHVSVMRKILKPVVLPPLREEVLYIL